MEDIPTQSHTGRFMPLIFFWPPSGRLMLMVQRRALFIVAIMRPSDTPLQHKLDSGIKLSSKAFNVKMPAPHLIKFKLKDSERLGHTQQRSASKAGDNCDEPGYIWSLCSSPLCYVSCFRTSVWQEEIPFVSGLEGHSGSLGQGKSFLQECFGNSPRTQSLD